MNLGINVYKQASQLSLHVEINYSCERTYKGQGSIGNADG
jgi:hypothetical protein